MTAELSNVQLGIRFYELASARPQSPHTHTHPL